MTPLLRTAHPSLSKLRIKLQHGHDGEKSIDISDQRRQFVYQRSWTWCWIAPREPGQVSIHQYISGRPLDQLEIVHNSTDALRPLLAELGDSLAQLRA
ncbi:kinase-like domain [Cordyceps militaris]|uniref:Kinase-like domain n=1 Tax=Cordyceps militaris TaxID=73501 RepID=A0A2H4SI94_CORMI|nr:kinase-like domain [Cordyceps militaris]